MIIICPTHGATDAVMVAPDLADHLDNNTVQESLVIIAYECMGDIVQSYFLSEEFARTYGISASARQEIPEDYPEFVFRCKGYCRKCFEEKTGKSAEALEADI